LGLAVETGTSTTGSPGDGRRVPVDDFPQCLEGLAIGPVGCRDVTVQGCEGLPLVGIEEAGAELRLGGLVVFDGAARGLR